MRKAHTKPSSRRSALSCLLLAQATVAGLGSTTARATDYSTLLGAANIDAAYYLNPNEDVLNDAQSQLDAVGSHTEKLELDQYDLNNTWSSATSKYAWNSNWPAFNSSTTLVSMAQMAPLTKAFSDPSISSYDLTTYSPNIPGGGDGTGYWAKGMTTAQEQAETTSFYNLTKYLMQTYSGTGKSFYLSNWEGDGALVDALPSGDTVPSATEVKGMIQWLNARQAGIDEARSQFATQDPDVKVYGTIEVNHVQAAMQGDVYNGESGFATVTNDVLPYTTTDFVSYSSYDTQKNATGTYSYANAVAYVAAHLPVTAINGQNTQSEYVGEFGLAENYSGSAEVNSTINNVINTATADGMPLAFYWEVYSNELNSGVTTPPGGDGNTSAVQGFYLVKPDGTPATAWSTYRYLIAANDPTQATGGAVERSLHLAYASNFSAPGATLGSAWTTNTSGGAMSVGITNGQVQMTTVNAANTPVGQATLNIDSVLGRGLEVGEYLQFTLNRQNNAGIIGLSAFGVNHGSAIAAGNQPLDVYPNVTGYGWTPMSYNGSNNTNPAYNWNSPSTTLGLRLTSANGDYATISYYVNGTYSGSWLYPTTATSLDSFSLFSQSSTANAEFAFSNLAIYTSGTQASAINYRWDPAHNGSASGGAGTWDFASTSDIYNGAADVTWNVATLADQVTFGGTAGTVTIASSGVTASTLVFNTPDYVISGGAITLLGNQTINAANGLVTFNNAITGSNGLTITGSGVVALAGTNTFSNGLYVSAGATAAFSVDANLGASGQQLLLDGGTLQYTGTTAPTMTRTINIGASGGLIDLVNNAAAGKLIINGTNLITGNGNITKTGPGWLTLYGSNNATGNWNVNGGVVEAGGVSVLGTGSVTINNGGELSNTASGPIPNPVVMNTGGTLSADYNSTSTGTYSGAIAANGNFNVRLGNFWNGTSQSVTLAGNISGAGSITTTFASGDSSTTGVLTLSGNNSGFSGNINVTGGTLTPAVSSNNVLGTGSINLSGGKLALRGSLAPSGTTPIAPMSVTGFNKDEIFGSPDASAFATATAGADGTFSYYQTGYTPQFNPAQTILNTYTTLTGGISGQNLTSVTNNTIYQAAGQSIKTPFSLQSFMADNALQVPKGSTGTLSLATPAAYADLAILAASTNAADNTPSVTINFIDGTSVTTTYKAYDWSIGNDAARESADIFGPSGVNRYSPTTSPGWDERAFGMYETDIDLTDINGVDDSEKLIASVTFAATTGINGLTNIFALSGTSRPMVAGGPNQAYGNNVSITANSDIDVSGSLNAYMQKLSIGTATLTVSSADTTNNPYTLNFQSTGSNGSPTFDIANSAGGGHGTLKFDSVQTGSPIVANPQVFQGFSIIGGTVAFAAHPVGGAPVVTEMSSLSLTGSGTLDLNNNDLIIHNGNLTAVTGYIKSGYGSGGNWQGVGIASSTAADDPTHLTSLGTILNTNRLGAPIYTTFDGQSAVAGDVLVKYTYYGDANLDGQVDGSDYTLIDNGFNNHLTGWYNGDFNYDGTVDGSDYTLIDNAFNTQSSPLAEIALLKVVSIAAQVATGETASLSSSVPEPAPQILFAAVVIGALPRRRRASGSL
jgi:hypothetical protein